MTKRITKISNKSFIVSEVHALNVEQCIDFSPFQEYYGLTGDYCLVHWLQPAMGESLWGIYTSYTGEYYLLNEVPLYKPIQVDFLSIPPNVGKSTPQCCIRLGCTRYDHQSNRFIVSS